jgi:hypothetical protein
MTEELTHSHNVLVLSMTGTLKHDLAIMALTAIPKYSCNCKQRDVQVSLIFLIGKVPALPCHKIILPLA